MNRRGLESMCVTMLLQKLNLERMKAEILGNREFTCPVCGGRAVWNRENRGKRMICRCHGCGMYLQGTERRRE